MLLGLIIASSRFWLLGPKAEAKNGVFGGPEEIISPEAATQYSDAAVSGAPNIDGGEGPTNFPSGEPDLLDASFKGSSGPSDSVNQNGVFAYTIEKGNTISGIAASFGVSVETILAANKGLRASSLMAGQEIKILPVSGIIYRAKDGETIQSIASTFNLSVDDLMRFNRGIDPNGITVGTALVIPGARPNDISLKTSGSDLPRLDGYFIGPADGFNWGQLHAYNAVDIANSCGTPVVSAAEGLVVYDPNYGDGSTGWNGGYGHFILIEHPNGTKTRYAHLDAVSVSVGDYVDQGKQIGTMGATGNVHGPTGCHLHFEVYGAQNPFAKD